MNNEIKDLIKEIKDIMRKENEFPYWFYLNKMELIMKALQEEPYGKAEIGVHIQGKLSIGRNSVIKAGTRIEGNVFIGDDCIIGPNAFLRGNVILEGNNHVSNSEIKNSIILNNSNVPHYSYVGDSIIGQNCNLGAGTKIANLRFDETTIKVSVKGQVIDTKLRKLGCLIHDNVRTGVNSGINCGVIIYPGMAVNPNYFTKDHVKVFKF